MNALANRRQYKNPPITEAICAIHFAPGLDWDPTIPAVFYGKVRDEYNGKSREQKLVHLDQNPKEIQAKGTAGMAVNEITRIQFVTKDEKKIISLYQDDLSVAVLRPYPGWEEFRPSIEKALETYISVVAPKAVRRVGIRYINHFETSGEVLDLFKCFATPPTPLANTNSRIENFATRQEYVYQDDPIKVAVTLARLSAQSKKPAAVLDIDLVWQWPAEPLPINQVMSKVDELRQRERIVFESLITDHARKLFDA